MRETGTLFLILGLFFGLFATLYTIYGREEFHPLPTENNYVAKCFPFTNNKAFQRGDFILASTADGCRVYRK